ncbi:O-antigen ligase family protein [Pseudomonas sp. NPDC078700]|uniref:O-antigen ligase family protein n=1 Tax=Pseudomonas sp. NPDC078700 TaxID=3364424 RepID=UPI0037C5B1C3
MRCSSITLERMLIGSVLLFLLWLPLPIGSNRDWSAALLIFLCALLAIGWAINALRRNRDVGPTLKAGLPMFGLLVLCQFWVLLQWLGGVSVDTGATFQYLMLGCAYSLLFLLVTDLFRTRKRLSLLLGTLVVSGTFQAFFGVVMTLSGVEHLLIGSKTVYVGDATGTFVNRNHLAGYLEMTLACGIGLLLALRDERQFRWVNLLETLLGPKARLRLALVMMTIALVMSHSRMGNAAFFVSLLLVGGLFVLVTKEHRLRNSVILGSLLLIDMLVVSQYFGLDKLVDRMASTQFENVLVDGQTAARANEMRDNVFAAALPLARECLFTGHGAGSFEVVFPKAAGADITQHFDHAHNDYLQFIIEYGLLGSLPLLAFVIYGLYHAQRAMWQHESVYRSGVGFGASLGILTLLIHSLADFNLQIPANAATYVVICAVGVLANNHFRERRARARS